MFFRLPSQQQVSFLVLYQQLAAIDNNVRLFINCSSMARYGKVKPPFTEDMPPNPVDPYGLAKVQAEDHLKILNSIHGLNYLTVVPHNVIGVGQRYYDPFRNVVRYHD